MSDTAVYRAPSARPRVLVVEDEQRLRDLWLRELPTMEADGLGASDGEEALAVIERERVDVVLLDLSMPRMDGMAFLTRLRDRLPDVPVIIITAHAALESAQEAIRLGVTDYLRKPCLLRDIEGAIARAWAKARTVAPQPSGAPAPGRQAAPAVEPLDAIERRAIFAALDRHDGNRAAAARALGISRRTLYNRLRVYGSTP